MHVTAITQGRSPDDPECIRVGATVRCDDRADAPETLWFDLPADIARDLPTTADPWVAALLPLACKLGEDLRIDAPIDPMLLDGTRELMEWWRYWFPSMKVVAVHASGIGAREATSTRRSTQFFSGGVDSFFTLLRHANDSRAGVDDLLVGWGFDIPLADRAAFRNVRESLGAVARALSKRLIAFSTNLRETRAGHEIPWGTIGHGSAMAAVALLTADSYSRVLIPSTDGYRETGPWGSHATTDHYYSCSTMRVIHDGAAYSRLEKVRLVAQSPVALSALRVCWREQSDTNCGRCEKCLRTMIALDLCDRLGDATTFPAKSVDLDQVVRIYCPWKKEGSLQLYYLELRDEAIRRDRRPLARALTAAMRRSGRYQLLLRISDGLSRLPGIGGLGKSMSRRLKASTVL